MNNCENFSTFNDLVVRFNVNISHPAIAEFINIKLENYDQFMEYFHSKL